MKLLSLLEYLNSAFFAWTIIYFAVLLCRFPACAALFVWLPVVAALSLWYVVSRLRAGRHRGSTFDRLVLAVACLWAAPTLCLAFQNNDDFSLFCRVLWQLRHPAEPFALHDTEHSLPDLPSISGLHVATSYEPLVGSVADLVGADPLFVYQHVGSFLGAALLVVVYFLLYRRFRFGPTRALGATAVALCFLAADGGPPGTRSFGNLAFIMWKAKFILWLVLLPFTLLMALRFLSRPTWGRWAQLGTANVCGVGLSNTGVFLPPALVFAVSVAALLAHGRTRLRLRLRRAVLLNLSSAFSVGLAVALLLGVIPEPADRSVWGKDFWPHPWTKNLVLMIPDRPALLRNLFLVLAPPLLALGRPLGRLLVAYALVLGAVFFNPITGPVWFRLLQPGNYWRLVFLLPFPWYAGLVVGRSDPFASRGRMARRVGTAAALLFLVVWACRSVSFNHTLRCVRVQSPGEDKFNRADLALFRAAGAHLDGRLLLAPEDAAVVCGLKNPRVRLYTGRGGFDTRHLFANAGRAAEGLQRAAAQVFVTGNRSAAAADAFRTALAEGVTAVVTSCANAPHVLALLKTGPGHWVEAVRTDDYVLFVRD